MKHLYLFFLVLSVCLVVSCNTEKEPALDSPEAVVEAYQKAILTLDFDKARGLVTEESYEVIDYVESFKEMFDDLGFEEEEMDATADDLTCEIDGKKAVCSFTDTYGEKQSINAVNRDGVWLLDIRMPKEEKIDLEQEDTESILDSLLQLEEAKDPNL